MARSRVKRRTYQPTPLIVGSALLHAVALPLAVAALFRGGWKRLRRLLGLLLADHLVLSAAGAWPRSRLLGPNVDRLPPSVAAGRVALTFDDGPDPRTTPGVLDLLDAHGARATFFCVGRRVAEHPELAREIVRRGHGIANHTFQHPNLFAFRFPRALEEEIVATQDEILRATGERPAHFRPPAGMRNPFMEPVLARLGLHMVTWTRRGFDAVSNDARAIADRLLRDLGDGEILLLHDGRLGGGRPSPVLEVLPRLLDGLEERGLRGVALPEN